MSDGADITQPTHSQTRQGQAIRGQTRRGQTWDPDRYARSARFVADLGMPVVELLNPQPGERILDLGCGDGALTEKLAAFGCLVVGVDGSAEQIEAARKRGLDAHVVDGQALSYDNEFDAVFSNAALHWMKHSDAVLAGVWQALKPGGRFVAECGGAGNIATIVAAVYQALQSRGIDPEPINPWYFPTPKIYTKQLQVPGFVVTSMDLIPRPTPLPGDIIDWLEIFTGTFLNAVPDACRSAALYEIRDVLRPDLCDAEGKWTADYVRLRFVATKPN